jgi:hypothetical protein
MTRLEELALLPSFAGPGPARTLVPRAEAYTLFSRSLIVPRAERNALACRLRDAITAARRRDEQREGPARATVLAQHSQGHDSRRAGAHIIAPPVVGSIAAEPIVVKPPTRLESLDASQPVGDPVTSATQAPADGALPTASAVALRLDRMLAGNVRGLLARARSGLPTAHRPPDPR